MGVVQTGAQKEEQEKKRHERQMCVRYWGDLHSSEGREKPEK